MPVLVHRDPFGSDGARRPALKTPQARVLAVLMPDDPTTDPLTEWPLATRAVLALRAGFTAMSGTITRVMNGVREGSSSGDAHPGMLALGYVKEVILDIEGVKEVNYQLTSLGFHVYQSYLAQVGRLPAVRDAAASTNKRYQPSLRD